MNNSNDTTVSAVGNANELLTLNIPQEIFKLDEAKRDEIRALTPDQQIQWAKAKMDNLRDLLITAMDSVNLANDNLAAFCIALNEVLSGEAWAILGYNSPEACIKEELSLEQLGKIRQARGEVSHILKKRRRLLQSSYSRQSEENDR
ncbi:helix-turn-helix domain containing protein [Alloscardovia omnicolens]|uniref:helix-turn-helix domain containing protein n=1 Tax=Alloscardovia omnicolens TaxID=419015 RepID=UPI003A658F61